MLLIQRINRMIDHDGVVGGGNHDGDLAGDLLGMTDREVAIRRGAPQTGRNDLGGAAAMTPPRWKRGSGGLRFSQCD